MNFSNNDIDCRVGFLKFASLRSQHCVLAGSSGTHTICVRSMHQNVNLMMLGKLYTKKLCQNNSWFPPLQGVT